LCFNHKHNETRKATVLLSFHLLASTDEATEATSKTLDTALYSHN